MAFVITIAQRKGGAGKTTIACQLVAMLAAEGWPVAGVDLDEQGSFSEWAARRNARPGAVGEFPCERANRFGLYSALRRAARAAEIVIIDTPPTADGTVGAAVRAADLVLTPLQLSPLDLDAAMPTARLVGAEGKTPLFVVNRAPPRARIADLIRREIKRQNLPLAGVELGARAAFSESLASGRGVVETAGRSRAAEEIRALGAEITRRIEARDAAERQRA